MSEKMRIGARWRSAVGSRFAGPAIVAFGAALALAVVVGSHVLHADAPSAAGVAAASAPGTFRPTEAQWKGLAIAPVALRAFRPEQLTQGNIAADDYLSTPVFSPFSGRVTRVFAKLGDRVAKGDPLFAVDATEFVQAANTLITAVAAANTARSQRAQAEINERRAHELYTANGGALKDWQQSRTDLVTAQNNLRSAEIALAAARNQLRILGKSDEEVAALEAQPTQKLEAVAIVPAPIAGTVTQRQVGLGQYIQSFSAGASNPVYTIGDLSTVWLVAAVPEAGAGSVTVGAPVEVRVPAYPARVFNAKISWVAPTLDPNTHRLSVRADVENRDDALKPLMFADFTIVTGQPVKAPAVPQEAIVYEGASARVWVARDDHTLESRTVELGREADGMVEIVKGLSAGDKVVTRGALFIDRAGGTG